MIQQLVYVNFEPSKYPYSCPSIILLNKTAAVHNIILKHPFALIYHSGHDYSL
jgi:hypothetical protein